MTIDRRSFIKRGAAGILGASLIGVSQVIGGVPNKRRARLKKALKYGMIEIDGSVHDKFALAKQLGFDGIELDAPSDLDRSEVIAARDSTGLPIHGVVDSVHWEKTLGDPDPAVRKQGRDGLLAAIDDAAAYGATTVLLVPAVVNKDISYDEAYKRSQDEVRQVLPVAAEKGIKIALENVWNHFLLSPIEFARYIDEFQSPWIGAYFDVGNIVNYGWPEQWIKILGPRILKVDIKGYSRTRRDQAGPWAGFEAEIGDDDNNWPVVRKALADIGYSGWATAEVNGGDEARLKEIARRMDEHVIV